VSSRFRGAFDEPLRTVRSSKPSPVSLQILRTSLSTPTLPPFNPDLEGGPAPAPVARFRAALQECDAVLISSPEYAHGVPGVLKNALDWVVGSGEFVDKPVALINTSARATHAWASLAETLSVMSACVVLDASITVPLGGRTLDADSVVRDAAFASALRSALTVLAAEAREARAV
jgi:chromate reductase